MMKLYSLLLIIGQLSFSGAYAANYSNVRAESCQKDTSGPYVYADDFNWNMTLQNIKSKSTEIYESGKRLKNRAFFDGKDVVMPLEVSKEVKNIKLSSRFLESVQKHIEEGFKRGYIDAVIFPDMGHSHYFVPQKFYDALTKKYSWSQKDKIYEEMINHPGLKILYHTAEQLQVLDENRKLLDDRVLQWRFFTRNLVGDNKAQGKMELLHEPESKANTSHNYAKGYKYWGAGFNISASKDGCFSYAKDGKKFYFDLSFEDLTYNQTDNGDF